MAKIRHNVWKIPPTDDTLLWYGRAIGEMQKLPITDPTSWRFQAAIHDYVPNNDPLAVPGEKLPSASTRKKFWRQCQHGSWFFLPWHRMYLHFFEDIIAAEVVKLGGPKDWALPYWNYSATDAKARLLPEAFRNPKLPDGSKNYLFVAERDPRCNAGQSFAHDRDVDLRTALIQAFFSDSVQGNFGGLPTNFAHNGSGPGQLEIIPHGSIHTAVGGSDGWMGAFNTAGLDPIFWLHHANIDRLWQVWLNRDAGHKNPASLQWLNMIPFTFYSAAKKVIVMRCSEVIDTSALGYTYDDVTDPLTSPAPAHLFAAAVPHAEVRMANRIPPELIGATEASFQVENAPVRLSISTPSRIHSAARLRLSAAFTAASPTGATPAVAPPEPHVLLQLENITAAGRANSYDVYVNVPDGEDPTQHPELLAGRLALFGVAEASRATDQHPGSGLTFTLDISNIYQGLSKQAGWDPENIHVSFVPVRDWKGVPVTVGRVSLFFG